MQYSTVPPPPHEHIGNKEDREGVVHEFTKGWGGGGYIEQITIHARLTRAKYRQTAVLE